jgi:hypothetical protein
MAYTISAAERAAARRLVDDTLAALDRANVTAIETGRAWRARLFPDMWQNPRFWEARAVLGEMPAGEARDLAREYREAGGYDSTARSLELIAGALEAEAAANA